MADADQTTQNLENSLNIAHSTPQEQLNICHYVPSQLNPLFLSQQQSIAPYQNIPSNYYGIASIHNKSKVLKILLTLSFS